MSQIREGGHFFQVGYGIPVHIAQKATIYTDRSTGLAYINKNNLSQWNVFPDVVMSGITSNPFIVSGQYTNGTTTLFDNSGGTITITGYFTGTTDVFVTGGTYSNGTAIFRNTTGGTFSVTGFSTTTLQQAYNNSTNPQITTTTALSALTIQRGSAADTDILLQFRNGAGATNATIDGTGNITTVRSGSGANISSTNAVTTNLSNNGIGSTSIVQFGSFSTYTSNAQAVYGIRRFQTLSSGVSISTTVTSRQSAFAGYLHWENDVAGNNNTVTVNGGNPISVFYAKTDFWPIAGAQTKTIAGSIAAYSTYLDLRSNINCQVDSYIDFDAGRANGSIGQTNTITNRYGFRVADMSAQLISGNRWGFYQEGTTDKNLFNGNTGLGVSTPLAKLHITAGTTTVPPIIISSGVTTTTPIDGAIEYDGVHFYGSIGSNRKQLDNDTSASTASIIITAKTTDYSILSTQTGYYFTNEGAAGTVSYTLPTATTNLIYTFINQSGNQLVITANSGDTIRSRLNVTSVGGNISSTDIGSTITLVAINSTEWIATSINDTWVF